MFPLLLLLLVFGRFAAIYEKKWMMVSLISLLKYNTDETVYIPFRDPLWISLFHF
jgi:hypothetical protein